MYIVSLSADENAFRGTAGMYLIFIYKKTQIQLINLSLIKTHFVAVIPGFFLIFLIAELSVINE